MERGLSLFVHGWGGLWSHSQCRQSLGWRESYCSFCEVKKGKGWVDLTTINSHLLATDSEKVVCLEVQQAGTSSRFLPQRRKFVTQKSLSPFPSLSDHLHLTLRCSFNHLFLIFCMLLRTMRPWLLFPDISGEKRSNTLKTEHKVLQNILVLWRTSPQLLQNGYLKYFWPSFFFSWVPISSYRVLQEKPKRHLLVSLPFSMELHGLLDWQCLFILPLLRMADIEIICCTRS